MKEWLAGLVIGAAVLVLFSFGGKFANAFNPDELTNLTVIYDSGCKPWYCVIAKKDNETYLIVLEGKSVVFIYAVILDEDGNFILGDVLWARDLI